MEKQIKLYELRAVYTKDFDTFDKMDPFLEFILGTIKIKTATAKSAGKQPKWTDQILFTYYEDQTTIIVNNFEQDNLSNDYIGQSKIDLTNLKPNGDFQLEVVQQDGNRSGTIFGKYIVKNLQLFPTLKIKNIKCDFFQDTEFLLKTKPFFSVATNGTMVFTEPKQKGESRQLSWNETLRIKMKENERIIFCLEDKNDATNKIFCYESFPNEFKFLLGTKVFYVIDRNFEPLGTLELFYETQNFVTKEESQKNEENSKKIAEELQQIKIITINSLLSNEIQDLYFKIVCGRNNIKTNSIKRALKDALMNVNESINAQKTDNKIIFAAFSEVIKNDKLKGSGQLLLDKAVEGKNNIKLFDSDKKSIGQIFVNLKLKNVPCRELIIKNIRVMVKQSTDVVGDPEIYVIVNFGGSTRRTEVQQGMNVKYDKQLQFKYSQEKQITLHIYDEDVTKDELVHKITVNLEELEQKGQFKVPLIPEQHKNNTAKHGELTFTYEHKNKLKPIKKQQPKKEEPKKEESKKEEPKKQEPKKQERKKQEPKKLEPIKQNPSLQKKPIIINERKPVESIVKQLSSEKSMTKSLDKSNNTRSRKTIRLPSLPDQKNYGNKIYDRQSASTMQKSIHVYSAKSQSIQPSIKEFWK